MANAQLGPVLRELHRMVNARADEDASGGERACDGSPRMWRHGAGVEFEEVELEGASSSAPFAFPNGWSLAG